MAKSIETLNSNSDALRDIVISAKADNELTSERIAKSQKDSNTIKVLTYVALIYLPAGLVAVISLPNPSSIGPEANLLLANIQLESCTIGGRWCSGCSRSYSSLAVVLVVPLLHTWSNGAYFSAYLVVGPS